MFDRSETHSEKKRALTFRSVSGEDDQTNEQNILIDLIKLKIILGAIMKLLHDLLLVHPKR